jgi:hypothetical protein
MISKIRNRGPGNTLIPLTFIGLGSITTDIHIQKEHASPNKVIFFQQCTKVQFKLVLIVTGTVTDVPQTSPHLVSGAIIVYVIDNTALLQ